MAQYGVQSGSLAAAQMSGPAGASVTITTTTPTTTTKTVD